MALSPRELLAIKEPRKYKASRLLFSELAHFSALSLFAAQQAGEWYAKGYLAALLKSQADEAQREIQAHIYARTQGEGVNRNRLYGDEPEEHDCGLFDAFYQMATTDEGKDEVHGIWRRMNEIKAQRAGLRYEDQKLWEEILRIQRGRARQGDLLLELTRLRELVKLLEVTGIKLVGVLR